MRKKRIEKELSDELEDDLPEDNSAPSKKTKVNNRARNRRHKKEKDVSSEDEVSEEKILVTKKKKVANEPLPRSIEEDFFKIITSNEPLPGRLPWPVWSQIISFLSPYEQNLSRFWSRAFRNLSADLVSTNLRKIVITLGYEIPPQNLGISALYFRRNAKKNPEPIPITAEQKKKLFQLLRKLSQAFVQRKLLDYRKSLEKICELIEIRLKPKRAAGLHPILLSVLIDYLYFILAMEDNVNALFNAKKKDSFLPRIQEYIEAIASRSDLTKNQKIRLTLLQALFFFKEGKPVTSFQYLDELFAIKLEARTFEILKKNIHSPFFYLGSKDLSRVTCSDPEFDWVSFDAYTAGMDRKYGIFHGSMSIREQTNLFLDRYPDFKEYFVKEGKPILIPAGLKLLLEEHLETRKCEENPPHRTKILGQLLVRRDLDSPVPFWVRSYLFAPDSLNPGDLSYLQKFDLSKLPPFVFKREYTFGELVKFKPYFKLFEQGVLTNSFSVFCKGDLESLIGVGHDIGNIHRLAALNEPNHESDLGDILFNIKPTELDAFLRSWVWQEIQSQGIENLYFVAWAIKNFSFLESMNAEVRKFFKKTLAQLFSTCQLWVKQKEKQGRVRIRISYFELIRRSFYPLTKDKGLSRELFECLFTAERSILAKLMQQNPDHIYAPFLVSSTIKNPTDIFIDCVNNKGEIFSEVDVGCDYKHLIFACLTKNTLEALVEKKYKELSLLRWLSKPAYREVFLRLVAFVHVEKTDHNSALFAGGWVSDLPTELQYKLTKKEILKTINHFAEIGILDDPKLCCLWLQENNAKKFMKPDFKENNAWRRAVYKALPEALTTKDFGFLELKSVKQYKGRPYCYYLEKTEYEEFFAILFLNNIPCSENLLDVLAENDLMDKPEYASLILEKLGEIRFFELGTRLKYFSQVKDRATLAALLREIKRGFIEKGISLVDYVDEHFQEAPLEIAPEISMQAPRQYDPGFFPRPPEIDSDQNLQDELDAGHDQLGSNFGSAPNSWEM